MLSKGQQMLMNNKKGSGSMGVSHGGIKAHDPDLHKLSSPH